MHTLYIRHCLDELAHSNNVIFLLGEEFTGPQHFVEFWLETVAKWEREHNRNVIVILSATRDVQDAILDNPELRSVIDGIDMKYWWPTRDGGLYNPPGGQNLAPRQQLREWKGSKNASAESLARGVREMRLRYPDKAVICSVSGADPWLTLAAGGSLVPLPPTTEAALLRDVTTYQPKAIEESNLLLLGVLQSADGSTLEVRPSAVQNASIEIDRTTGQRLPSKPSRNEAGWRIYWKR